MATSRARAARRAALRAPKLTMGSGITALAATLEHLNGMVIRYRWDVDNYGEYDCDEVCYDMKTGSEVVRYDAGDPANHNPAYGGWSKKEWLRRKGLDPNAEIHWTEAQPRFCVTEEEARHHAERKRAVEERRIEEENAKDLLQFLGEEKVKAFSFSKYAEGEREILQPALYDLRFTNVSFYTIEGDSFGPLIRGCVAHDPTGKRVRFFYG